MNFKEEMIEAMLATRGAQRNNEGVTVRCPYCGDSVKSMNHGHCSVTIPEKDDEPMLWHCYRCDDAGIVNQKFIDDLELDVSTDVIGEVRKYHGLINGSPRNRNKLRFNQGYKLEIPHIKYPEIANRKKSYLEDRMGVSLSYEEWAELKVVFNLAEVVCHNQMEILCKREMMKFLNISYMGFLTAKNEFCVCRDVTGESKLRYYKYQMAKDVDKSRKYYVIPNNIDLLSTEPININLAEGTFDILGIYFRLYNQNKTNNIYAAACGCGFASLCEHFIGMGIFGNNITINIYSDKDKQPEFYSKLLTKIKPFVGAINVFYNQAAKDYGDVRDRIDLTKAVI